MHKTYDEQLCLLKNRGMIVENDTYAIKKLEQLNYYRLSGFWYICRKFVNDTNAHAEKRLDIFEIDTSFNKIIELYKFDK
jgi:abortive infection bacteriophage resistance protein